MSQWTIENSKMLYNIAGWSEGYFTVNNQGHICMQLPSQTTQEIDLYYLVKALQQQQLRLPILVRFQDILQHRAQQLWHAFDNACKKFEYNGHYTAVYPIKVNQQRSVVETIVGLGKEKIGLEAGSKPELMVVLALSEAGGIIICNGYKDREYIRLALIGRRLGHKIYIVIEKPSELKMVLEESQALNIKPLLGLRVRLASLGTGKWQNTGGEKAKFGLSAAQVLTVVNELKDKKQLDCLQLLHFHMGSQIANIRDIQKGLREAGRYYSELHRLGVPLNCVDVGGGLGIDYEGSRSRNNNSINYQLQEYANNIVRTLKEICKEYQLPYPDIITESGRAMTAHHAVLITNITDVEKPSEIHNVEKPSENDPAILQDLWKLSQNNYNLPLTEVYHEASYWLSEAHSMYSHGVITLEQRAQAEALYFNTCKKIQMAAQENPNIIQADILKDLNEKLADKYFCNFSLFQSVPDIWGINQIFPIMPLHRLEDYPEKNAIIGDLTCDSDGQISDYVSQHGISSALSLHNWQPEQPYLIGIFLVGAYQEILGDLHNLFGDTDSIDIKLTTDNQYQLCNPEQGDTIDELLTYVHFEPQILNAKYQEKLQNANLSASEYKYYASLLETGLSGYTYLED